VKTAIEALLFDGRSARGHPVRVHAEGDALVVEGATAQRWPLRQLEWPERTYSRSSRRWYQR
jgi:hypothetical protein